MARAVTFSYQILPYVAGDTATFEDTKADGYVRSGIARYHYDEAPEPELQPVESRAPDEAPPPPAEAPSDAEVPMPVPEPSGAPVSGTAKLKKMVGQG